MKPARFSYEAPTTVAETLAALAARGEDAKLIAGGQSLAPMMNMRLAQPAHLIDINGVAELAGIAREGDRLRIGALVRHATLARDATVRAAAPLLAAAAATIGHYAVRTRGTLGGSLAHADPAAQLPLVCVTLDAELEACSARGVRRLAATDFFQSIFTTALASDELLAAVRLPVAAPGDGWSFRLLARRAGDFALVAVAATLRRRPDGLVGDVRLGIGGIASVPARLERALPAGLDPGAPGWAAAAAAAVAAAAEIEESERVSADYRRELVAALTEDALAEAWGRTA